MTAGPRGGGPGVPPAQSFAPPPVAFVPPPDDVGAGAEASDGSVDGLELGVWLPPNVGAARLGVVAAPAGFSLYDGLCTVDDDACSFFQTLGPWKASRPTN